VGEDGKKLKDVTFDLQKENGEELSKGLITDANGILLVEDLKPGTYKLVEKQTLDGSLVGKDPVHPFTIELGQEKTL
ncbi:prealbumin-like fold domain-containing protein, partial [Rossellomorea marisflavi]|uniref:prealbumin-like fold domain-containing protein n=1 Tax=Rossellomorea marisflavi TaxID=189381 RepID=UPI003AEA2299